MKNRFCAALALILALVLAACSYGPDPALLDSAKPPVPVTGEAPAEDSPAAAPAGEAEDMPLVTEPETETPAEAPIMICEPTEGAAAVEMVGGTVEGNYDEIVSYSLFQPEFHGLATAEADRAVNDFYGQMVFGLTDYAYEVVYKNAQERHTGANVTGQAFLEESDAGVLVVRYEVTVHYGDADEDELFSRVDSFDWSTGKQFDRE